MRGVTCMLVFHSTCMFHVTCRDLGRFSSMLHASPVGRMLVFACYCAGNMHATCMLHTCDYMYPTCMLHAPDMYPTCMLHATDMYPTCILYALYMQSGASDFPCRSKIVL